VAKPTSSLSESHRGEAIDVDAMRSLKQKSVGGTAQGLSATRNSEAPILVDLNILDVPPVTEISEVVLD
jgi:hypothetical protein